MLKGNILICVLLLFFSAFKSTIAIAQIDQITGHEIKKQAAQFFTHNDLSVELLVSDSRRFHKCDDGLDFKPRVKNDWTSVIIACGETGWQKVLRAHVTVAPSIPNDTSTKKTEASIVAKENIIAGQVILKDQLTISHEAGKAVNGAYSDLFDVIGRKAKVNLSRGTILKARHLEIAYAVEQDDIVLVSNDAKGFQIMTKAKALEPGQIGDQIKLMNLHSGKIIYGLVDQEKKVVTLTNK